MSTKARRTLSLIKAGRQLNVVYWPLVAVSALFLSLRIFLKLRQRRPLWWDDYVLMISWLALLSSAVVFATAVNLGYGLDPSEISPENANEMILLISVMSSLLILANLWSKTSFGITLLRLPLGRVRVWLVCTLIGLGTVAIGASAYLVWIQCLVADPPWSPYTGSNCMSSNIMIKYSVFTGCFSALIDFAFVVLPWKMLWGLQMKRSEKIGVTLAMGMGTLAAIAAIAKTTVFPRVYSADLTAGLQVSAWGALETAVSIMAASIPILRALVKQGQAGVPMGYQTQGGTAATGATMRSVFFQRTVFAPSLASSSVRVEQSPDEALAGKTAPAGDDEETGRTSVELDSYGSEARPRDFTV
ncbi:hypothetical protein CONLIGDRAFT_468532 [Coniochaeta ligniaria NRRL 30616]|uniref:Rhodopsin domain-containing protein n=1 Tax=Coniochaeta ligniaria NRRL 30616 TaxID=1408157 RepID=A0A1J7IFU8_9PEZI|nr:hypothetical protein CONLIGDRAFT_468532 [Coniochaeta ligniaria NRRL 30616]